MSLDELGPPRKKRRFFEEEPSPSRSVESSDNGHTEPQLSSEGHADLEPTCDRIVDGQVNSVVDFDAELLSSFVGHSLAPDVVKRLRDLSGDNLERAVNIYFDGSWQQLQSQDAPITDKQDVQPQVGMRRQSTPSQRSSLSSRRTSTDTNESDPHEQMPERRYVGAFGASGWATRSGNDLIRPGEKLRIERAQLSTLKAARGIKTKSDNNIVRFSNAKSQEIGRLEAEIGAWVGPLLDSHLCDLEATCVYAPEKIKTNDTVYLQLHCFLYRSAFESANYLKPVETNRSTGLFEAQETREERNLHLRQVSLVKLFDEINLQPSQSNAAMEKHKRQGLLKAMESPDDQPRQDADAQNSRQNESDAAADDPEEGEELQQDQLDSLYRKAQAFDFNTPEQNPASSFKMQLRKYQKQALHWMLNKERGEKSKRKGQSIHPLWEEYTWPQKDADDHDLPAVPNVAKFYVNPYSGELSLKFPTQQQHCLGGILADEMGLGKTIEMLSLIHTSTSDISHSSAEEQESKMNGLAPLPRDSSSIVSAPATTLVVAPMSLLAQWESEVERASRHGTMKSLVYYGTDRSVSLRNLCRPTNARNAPQVIITSYGTILSEYTQIAKDEVNRHRHGGLFSLEYHRIILDEAHHIKNRQSKTAKACYELQAIHRWVLTGTPIVNRLEDLFSLVHFLRVEPWSNFSFWKTFITVPFEAGDYVKALDVVQTVLEPLVLRRTKDMKTPEGEALVPLPPRTINIERIVLSKDERDVYDYIYQRARRTFTANVAAGTLFKSYTTIFAQILRLRQSCCHPVLTRGKEAVADEEDAAAAADIANGLADDMDLQTMIERFTAEVDEQKADKFGAHALKQIRDEAENECPICSEEPMIEQTVTGCWHSACKQCLLDYIEHQKSKEELPLCFNCREPINSRDIFEVVRHDNGTSVSSDQETPSAPDVSLRRVSSSSASAKVSALLTHLVAQRKSNPRLKSVVFSQFTSFLDLIEPALRSNRIPFLRFDGTMAQKQRAAVLTSFTSSSSNAPAGLVLLLSLRAGGVGLNLTAAERVYVMDPWWSWAVEAQAIDRVHRMGQENEVKVVRFICQDSIEEKMLRIQERKKFIASSLGMISEEERRAQRIEDIRELLS